MKKTATKAPATNSAKPAGKKKVTSRRNSKKGPKLVPVPPPVAYPLPEVDEKAKAAYAKAMQSLHTAVQLRLPQTSPGLQPQQYEALKQIQVGLNCTSCELGALLRILVKKELVDYAVFAEQLIAQLNDNVGRYEAELGIKLR